MESKGWIIVTGATGGMGEALCRMLSGAGYPVIMACRNMEKGARLRERLVVSTQQTAIDVMPLDLASLASVAAFVRSVKVSGRKISVLINNAGTMCGDFGLTEDGLERTVGVNYVGTYALTRGIVPCMAERGRIVNTLSCTYRLGKIDCNFLVPDPSAFSRFRNYSASKLALLLFTLELAEREKGVEAHGVDPGVVDTGMITMNRWFDPLADKLFRPFIRTPEQGAGTALWLATADQVRGLSGRCWKNRRGMRIPDRVLHHAERGWLWQATERLVREKISDFPF